MLTVSATGRHLQRDGQPWFPLGDTAWHLFARLTRDEARWYLDRRAAQGFTWIQASVLIEHGGLEVTAAGHQPLVSRDPLTLDPAYLDHIDALVGEANARGLVVGVLPSWGDKVGVGYWGEGPWHLINRDNAQAYGRQLGQRLAGREVAWVLGGDRPASPNQAVWRALAAGLRAGDEGRHLITYHPCGQLHSSQWFHDEPWLAFNMIQSGHVIDQSNYHAIALDYARQPAKPVLDGEPGYEDHPSHFDPTKGFIEPIHVRRSAYWAVFAGACGHVYGCNPVWQFASEHNAPQFHARRHWREAVELPGAGQLVHLRRLIESRPFRSRIPWQEALVGGDLHQYGNGHIQVTRDGTSENADATYLMAYAARPSTMILDLACLPAQRLRLWWYDPRDGTARDLGARAREARLEFTTPGRYLDDDGVLVIDDADAGHPAPGAA